MSYDIDLVVREPGQSLEEAVEAAFTGDVEPDPGQVDLMAIAQRLRDLLPAEARVESHPESLSVFEPATGLQLDLERSGGQVNLPLVPGDAAWQLALRVLAVISDGTRFVGYDPQRGVQV